MTRDEVLAMKTGRELDALVAEKVMGWTYGHPCPEGLDCLHWADEKGNVRTYKPPLYSTDVAAAWEVVEKMLERGGCEIGCYVGKSGGKWFEVNVITMSGEVKVTAHTAPEAICKAALLAVMGE